MAEIKAENRHTTLVRKVTLNLQALKKNSLFFPAMSKRVTKCLYKPYIKFGKS